MSEKVANDQMTVVFTTVCGFGVNKKTLKTPVVCKDKLINLQREASPMTSFKDEKRLYLRPGMIDYGIKMGVLEEWDENGADPFH